MRHGVAGQRAVIFRTAGAGGGVKSLSQLTGAVCCIERLPQLAAPPGR
jgi:hypothetical protein